MRLPAPVEVPPIVLAERLIDVDAVAGVAERDGAG